MDLHAFYNNTLELRCLEIFWYSLRHLYFIVNLCFRKLLKLCIYLNLSLTLFQILSLKFYYRSCSGICTYFVSILQEPCFIYVLVFSLTIRKKVFLLFIYRIHFVIYKRNIAKCLFMTTTNNTEVKPHGIFNIPFYRVWYKIRVPKFTWYILLIKTILHKYFFGAALLR